MSGTRLDNLIDSLSDRDLQVLADLDNFRLLTTRQLQRLHFADGHLTVSAGARACVRVLSRLRDHDLVRPLERRIGGVRSGSAGYIWHLGPAGERLLRAQSGRTARRRYPEPSRHFISHTLAVADLAVQLTETARTTSLDIVRIETEPANWQRFLSPTGAAQWLKPDLYVVTAVGDFEDHWFIEADLNTEHLPVILRQCNAYQNYLASGRHQAQHGVFPVVVWVTPTADRATAIQTSITAKPDVASEVYRVCTTKNFIDEFVPPTERAAPSE